MTSRKHKTDNHAEFFHGDGPQNPAAALQKTQNVIMPAAIICWNSACFDSFSAIGVSGVPSGHSQQNRQKVKKIPANDTIQSSIGNKHPRPMPNAPGATNKPSSRAFPCPVCVWRRMISLPAETWNKLLPSPNRTIASHGCSNAPVAPDTTITMDRCHSHRSCFTLSASHPVKICVANANRL